MCVCWVEKFGIFFGCAHVKSIALYETTQRVLRGRCFPGFVFDVKNAEPCVSGASTSEYNSNVCDMRKISSETCENFRQKYSTRLERVSVFCVLVGV